MVALITRSPSSSRDRHNELKREREREIDVSDNPLDSRAILAAEIAESVRHELRAKRSAAQLGATIEKSLLEEARRAELKLAYLRGAAAGAFSLFVLGRLFLSKISPIPPPTIGSLAAAL